MLLHIRTRISSTIFWGLLLVVGACAGCDDSQTHATHDSAVDAAPDATSDAGPDGGDASDAGCPDGPPVHCLLQELTGDHVDPGYTAGKAIGLVVGVAKPGARYVAGFGATTIGGSDAPDASSIFEIASVTKVYSGYLLATGILNGEVLLDDRLEDTFGAAVPTFSGSSIDLLDLATHTSGLPSYPNNLLYPGPVNPAREYTVTLLEEFLAAYTLLIEPGTSFEYSNLGSGILGQILVQASGEASFHALTLREIATPYGLQDTGVELSPSQQARKMQGYANGAPAPAIDIGDPLQGGGAIVATADDVLTFFEGAIAGGDAAWEAVMTPRRVSPNGTNAQTGYLLNIEDVGTHLIYSKNGGSPGFTSQVMFTMDPPLLVVLLSNMQATQGLYQLSRTILDELQAFPDF